MPWSKESTIFKKGWMRHYDGQSLAVLAARTSKQQKIVEDNATAKDRTPRDDSNKTPSRYKTSGVALDKIKHILKHGIKYIYGK